MLRKIIEIDETLCDGCGDCAIGCAEGAIRIIDGKAKLVKADFCDGFGDCIGTCHTGALTIVTREAPGFDEHATVENLRATGGEEAVRRYEEAQTRHADDGLGAILGLRPQPAPRAGGGCPGAAQRELRRGSPLPLSPAGGPSGNATPTRPAGAVATPGGSVVIPSELQQWPVQLHLVRPGAPFFKDRELVIMSTCGPLASAEVHQRYLRGRGVVVACPKLDDTSAYAQKLGAILADPSIPKAIVVIMEVPCCGGLSQLARQALAGSGRHDLVIEEHTLALTGELKQVRVLS
jgi:NAD-dependent dihydropyrimidine dehydrogenase PreA subunit